MKTYVVYSTRSPELRGSGSVMQLVILLRTGVILGFIYSLSSVFRDVSSHTCKMAASPFYDTILSKKHENGRKRDFLFIISLSEKTTSFPKRPQNNSLYVSLIDPIASCVLGRHKDH